VAGDVANAAAVEAERFELDVGDLIGELAEPLVQRKNLRVEADEDHAAPRVDLNLGQVHPLGHLATEVAGVQEGAVVSERPSVIATDQVGLMALPIPNDRTGTVRARVV